MLHDRAWHSGGGGGGPEAPAWACAAAGGPAWACGGGGGDAAGTVSASFWDELEAGDPDAPGVAVPGRRRRDAGAPGAGSGLLTSAPLRRHGVVSFGYRVG